MEQPRTFVLQGAEYPFPDPDGLTVGEARIIGQMVHNVRDALTGEVEESSMDFVAAMMVIGYLRENPTASRATAEQLVNSVPLTALREMLEDADAGPPEPKLDGSPGNSNASAPSSGDGSSNGSENPAAQDTPTGTPASATPSADSDQRILTR